MHLRPYRETDAAHLTRLFYETVRSVNLGDYTQAEVEAWAPRVPEAQRWHARLTAQLTVVAGDETGLIGFASVTATGHLDLLYCRRDRVRQGVGRALVAEAEQLAKHSGAHVMTTEASLTARPFFERLGYRVERANAVERNGVSLRNFLMTKALK